MWVCAVPCMLACMRRLSCKQTIIIPYKSDFPAGTLQLCKRITWTVMRCTDRECDLLHGKLDRSRSLAACVRTYVRACACACVQRNGSECPIYRPTWRRTVDLHACEQCKWTYIYAPVGTGRGGGVAARAHARMSLEQPL